LFRAPKFYPIFLTKLENNGKAKLLLRGTNLLKAKYLLQRPPNSKNQPLAAVNLSDGLAQRFL